MGKDQQHLPVYIHVKKASGESTDVDYFGVDCVNRFRSDIMLGKFDSTTIHFHNFSGYDNYHLLSSLLNISIDADFIYRGSRLLQLHLKERKLTFRYIAYIRSKILGPKHN